MAGKKKVSLSTFAAIVQATPDKLTAATLAAVRKSALRLQVFVEDSIRNNTPHALVDRGKLVASVVVIPTATGAIVKVDSPYAAPLEYGSRPFMPPLQPLIDWVKRKGLGNTDPEGMARAIRWKFFNHGMAPTFFFKKAMQAWKSSNTLPLEIQRRLLVLPPGETKPPVG